MTARTNRIDELLRQEIGQSLSRDLADPRIGFATITDVETTPDLRHAVVWVSVIGQAEDRDATLTALRRAMPHLRHDLGTKLRLKRIPEFHVRLDDSMERGTRVLQLLDQLEHGDASEPVPPADALPTPVKRIRREGDADASEDPGAQTDGPAGAPAKGQRGAVGRGSRKGGTTPLRRAARPGDRGRPARRRSGPSS